MIDTEKGIIYLSAADLHAATLIIRGEPAELSEESRLHLVTLLTIARVKGAAILQRRA